MAGEEADIVATSTAGRERTGGRGEGAAGEENEKVVAAGRAGGRDVARERWATGGEELCRCAAAAGQESAGPHGGDAHRAGSIHVEEEEEGDNEGKNRRLRWFRGANCKKLGT